MQIVKVLLLAMSCVVGITCFAAEKVPQKSSADVVDIQEQNKTTSQSKVVKSKFAKKNTKAKIDIGMELDKKLNADPYSKYRNFSNDPQFGFYTNTSSSCGTECATYRSKLVGQSRAMAEVQDSVSGFSSFNTGPYPMDRSNSKGFGTNDNKIYGFRTSFPVGGPGSSK